VPFLFFSQLELCRPSSLIRFPVLAPRTSQPGGPFFPRRCFLNLLPLFAGGSPPSHPLVGLPICGTRFIHFFRLSLRRRPPSLHSTPQTVPSFPLSPRSFFEDPRCFPWICFFLPAPLWSDGAVISHSFSVLQAFFLSLPGDPFSAGT